jgi:DNA-binding MarR family transcriptional regulator
MEVLVEGESVSDVPGLDLAEIRSWQNFLEVALRMSAMLNRGLVESHRLTLVDVRLLDMLNKSPAGAARMGDLADGLLSLPSRVTRQIRRLEGQGLVRREASPDDGRGVVAAITDEGRMAVNQAMITYALCVKAHFLDQLSRPQVAALGENCRRINAGLKLAAAPTRLGRA